MKVPRYNHNQLPTEYRDELSKFPGGTAVPMKMNAQACILLTCSVNDAEVYCRPGVIVTFTPQLWMTDWGGVFRLETQFCSQLNQPLLTFDCFLNPQAPNDGPVIRSFAVMDFLHYHIYDLAINYLYTKRITIGGRTRKDMSDMIAQATDHGRDVLGAGHYNYELALEYVKDQVEL